MQCFIFTGRLGKDPQLKYSQDGKAITKFSVAVPRDFDREKTDWFNVTVFGKSAENCATYLKKGQKVGVQGRVEINEYEGKYYTGIIADRVEFGDKPAENDGYDDTPPF